MPNLLFGGSFFGTKPKKKDTLAIPFRRRKGKRRKTSGFIGRFVVGAARKETGAFVSRGVKKRTKNFLTALTRKPEPTTRELSVKEALAADAKRLGLTRTKRKR